MRAMIPVLALTVLACADDPTATITPSFAHNQQGGAEMGVTDGWADGRTVEFFYNKDFFCSQPPASGATSGCELGEEPVRTPRGGKIPVLYVMTPLGFTPSNLQCPVVGDCINHPSTIDLSRVFGAGTENAALPAHSHIVEGPGTQNGPNAGWWEIEVIGVTDPAVWAQVEAGKSLARVRELQAVGTGITGDIPTNAFLFFGVRPK